MIASRLSARQAADTDITTVELLVIQIRTVFELLEKHLFELVLKSEEFKDQGTTELPEFFASVKPNLQT